ncbi:MAG: HlyC/CorC family transporter [Blastocatellia bacterium]|nr:HlyC/CorC family transporter [Blastocatellia bacterium]
MGSAFTEIAIVFVLLLINGIFSMSELAIVSVRKARLQKRAEQGDGKARAALELAEQPNDFLATVQVGITLVGILAGAFGGASLSEKLAVLLKQYESIAPYADNIAFGLVVLCITYFSLVIGELVPKQLALNHAEAIARAVANPMRWIAKICSPAVRLLSGSTDAILKLFGIKPSDDPLVTEDEVKIMVRQGAQFGVFEEAERHMVENIFHMSDQRVRALMTPRRDIAFLDLNDSPEEILNTLKENGYSRYLVCRDGLDNVVGMVRAKDLLKEQLTNNSFNLETGMRQPLFVPESMPALKVLENFKKTGMHLAVVMDEYGGTLGLATHHDILEAIAGDMMLIDEPDYQPVQQREDGSWILDGTLTIHDVKEVLELKKLPGEERGEYHTLSGFVMYKLGRIPNESDSFEFGGLRFEIIDMDQRRVDKVMVRPVESE